MPSKSTSIDRLKFNNWNQESEKNFTDQEEFSIYKLNVFVVSPLTSNVWLYLDVALDSITRQ